MTDPIAAVAASAPVLAGTPAALSGGAAEAAMAPPLQALHAAAGARDFAALMQPSAAGAGARLAATPPLQLRKAIESFAPSATAPEALAALAPSRNTVGMGPGQAVDEFARISQAAATLSTQTANATLMLSLSTALAGAADNTFHALLKSNE